MFIHRKKKNIFEGCYNGGGGLVGLSRDVNFIFTLCHVFTGQKSWVDSLGRNVWTCTYIYIYTYTYMYIYHTFSNTHTKKDKHTHGI